MSVDRFDTGARRICEVCRGHRGSNRKQWWQMIEIAFSTHSALRESPTRRAQPEYLPLRSNREVLGDGPLLPDLDESWERHLTVSAIVSDCRSERVSARDR